MDGHATSYSCYSLAIYLLGMFQIVLQHGRMLRTATDVLNEFTGQVLRVGTTLWEVTIATPTSKTDQPRSISWLAVLIGA